MNNEEKDRTTPDPKTKGGESSDLLTGSVLFIIFLIFMTVWMMTYA